MSDLFDDCPSHIKTVRQKIEWDFKNANVVPITEVPKILDVFANKVGEKVGLENFENSMQKPVSQYDDSRCGLWGVQLRNFAREYLEKGEEAEFKGLRM